VRRRILILVLALAAGCGRRPPAFAPPVQASLDLGEDPGGLKPYISMDDPLVDDHIVRDITSERGIRRWAFRDPELRFRVKDAGPWKFAAEFTVPEVTFEVTGPVAIDYAVNGQKLGTFRCVRAGDFRVEKALPAGLIEPGKEIHVTFEANPRWIAPDDGAQLSFLLRSAGFIQ
jgi:hypothetical protein